MDVLEVGRFAREALAVFRVALVFAPPEIGCVGDVRVRRSYDRQTLFSRADDKGRPTGRSGVL